MKDILTDERTITSKDSDGNIIWTIKRQFKFLMDGADADKVVEKYATRGMVIAQQGVTRSLSAKEANELPAIIEVPYNEIGVGKGTAKVREMTPAEIQAKALELASNTERTEEETEFLKALMEKLQEALK